MSINLLRTCRPALNSFAQTMRCNAFRTIESKRLMSTEKSSKPAALWKKLLVIVPLTGGAVWWLTILTEEREKRLAIYKRNRRNKTSLGGPFRLVDSNNKVRSSDEFKGQWLFIYFGFTHCPDICPDELAKMTQVVDLIDADERLPNLQPIMITIDPERDTPEVVGNYVKEFSPKFIGLSGSVEQVEKALKNYRVYYQKSPIDDEGDYIMDHTIALYLMDPEYKFVEYYTQSITAEEVAEGVKREMLDFEKIMKPTSPFVPTSLLGKI